MELATLPLPPSALARLHAAGFRTASDLDGLTPAELACELDVAEEAAAMLLVEVRTGGLGADAVGAPSRSALELLTEERSAGSLATFVPELDALLGGGVPLRALTEFAGVPGVGKTQLAMQLALDASIPSAFNGLDGEAVYIDTEGSFMPERALQMASALVTHLRKPADADGRARTAEQVAIARALEPRSLLERLHVYRVHDLSEQLGVIRSLDEFVGSREVRVVVVDSIAFHLRYGEMEYGRRLQRLSQMATALCELATRRHLAVVLINHVTTRVNEGGGAGGGASSSAVVPALGESWAHMCNVQIMLQWHAGERLATLYKGRAPGSAAYRVTEEGVRSAREAPAPAPLAPPAAVADIDDGWPTPEALAIAGAEAEAEAEARREHNSQKRERPPVAGLRAYAF